MAKQKGLLLNEMKFEQLINILGGAVGVQWDKEARKAFMDCMDAPDCTNARKVTLTTEFKPRLTPSKLGGRAEYCGCEVKLSISGAIPGKHIVVMTTADENGRLLFNPDAPEDPAQRTVQQVEDGADDAD